MRPARKVCGMVVRYSEARAARPRSHENASRNWIASRLAELKGYEFVGAFDPDARYGAPLYFVPDDTLADIAAARRLGIYSTDDLFGGVVPYSFVATKIITHPLVSADAFAPEGWSHAFSTRVRDAVFSGFSAFEHEDARVAGKRVLERGSARVKCGGGIGGRGQAVVSSVAELDAFLDGVDPEALAREGIVIEENLAEAKTYCVGEVRIADLVASYWGTQRTTTHKSGAQVYGGSDLIVVRGSCESLAEIELGPEARLALEQARKYDTAAFEEYPGLLVSRRNYDIAQGIDGAGRRCSGVLEQSWRIGGASAAEVSALQAFRADPGLRLVRASTVEVHGEADIPPDATLLFSGHDDHAGFITKYAWAEPYADAA